MGKGKGLVGIDSWCSRVQGGKPVIFLCGNRKSIVVKSICAQLWRSSLILPVSVLPLHV